jgi:hypothetical protein
MLWRFDLVFAVQPAFEADFYLVRVVHFDRNSVELPKLEFDYFVAVPLST